MRVLRGLHNAVTALWLILALTVLRVAPVAALFLIMGMDYRLAGTLVVIPAVVLCVFTLGAARGLVAARTGASFQPDDDYLLAVAQAARSRGIPVPTVLYRPTNPHDPPAPVAVRGWRWCFVYASDGISPEDLIDQVHSDLVDGTARLRPLLWAVSMAEHDWATGLRGFASTVRPGVTIAQRIYSAPLLLLLPPALLGYLVSLVLGLVTRAMIPRRLQPRRAPSTGAAGTPSGAPSGGVIAPMGRIIIALLVVFVGTYQGLGLIPGERTVWPWEGEPVAAEVIDVHVVSADDGLLGHLGVRHNSTWRPIVALPDGSQVLLAAGTTEVSSGELIPVVTWTEGDRDQHRHLHQTSWTRYVVMSVLMFGIALALSRPFTAGEEILLPVLASRRLSQMDYDQRVLTGRRHRRNRPRHLPGARRFAEDG